MGSPSLCAKPAKVAASNSSKVNLASRDNKANKVVSSNKLEVNRTKAMVKVKTSSSNSTMPPGGRIRLSSRRLASTRQESGMRISGYDNAPDRRARQQGWQSADYQNWYHGTSRGCHGFFR